MIKIMLCNCKARARNNCLRQNHKELSMPYPAGHRQATRKRIIESARKLFNLHGFENVSVKQIMAGAGMTHGAFYEYFKDKSALYSEVLSCFLTDPNWGPRWEGINVDLAASDAGAQIIRAYLSRQHFDDVENSCPMVALPTDVRRSSPAVKKAFETVFLAMVDLLEESVSGQGRVRREKAQGIAALCVGGLIVSRALRDVSLADKLREACMAVALGLMDSSVLPRAKAEVGPKLRRARRRNLTSIDL
jgi:TetR/AcrR family transcriptional regulator, transcriptional repressor for nem operon